MTTPLKIHKLEAQNVYKLKHVMLEFGEKGLIKIGGANAQGKSSLFNAIRIAFNGKAAADSKAVREGEEKGIIKIDCGDFIISRSITNDKVSVKITTKDGKIFSSPQKMLDEIKSNLSFSPDKFMKLDSKGQVETLKKLTGLDFSDLDVKKEALYQERTIVNREIKLREGSPAVNTADATLPDEEIRISDLIAKLNKITTENTEKRSNLAALNHLKITAKDLSEQIKDLNEKLLETNSVIKTYEQKDYTLEETESLSAQIQTAEETNRKIREKIEGKKNTDMLNELCLKSQGLTTELKSIDAEKKRRLQESNLPVDGLEFTEEGVYCDDIPFSQLSHSEKLRISIALGMALNPNLRMILVEDASLFDEDNLKVIAEMAADNDYQVLAEIVTKSAADEKGCEIILENGEVKK